MVAALARLIQATRLAATEPPRVEPEALIRQAASAAADTLARGQAVPLPVLLDLLTRLRGGANFRARYPGDPRADTYAGLLDDLLDCAHALSPDEDDPYATPLTDLELTPLAGSAFSAAAAGPDPELAQALLALAAGQGVTEVLAAWRGPRSLEHWSDWLPDQVPSVTARPGAGTTWSAFASLADRFWLDEDCDHEAARRFLLAENPHRSRYQEQRLSRLRRQRPVHEPNPLPSAYDEPNILFGASTLATLANDEYGEFLMVNRADPRLCDLPLKPPPRPLHLHLCWAYGPSALERSVPAPVFRGDDPTVLADAHGSLVSVLQAFCALVFDDWRTLLSGVNVRLYAHCGSPVDGHDDFGLPGHSFQPGRYRRAGPTPLVGGAQAPAWDETRLPPPRFVRRFFSRGQWVGLDAAAPRWTRERSTLHRWYLVLVADDLAGFGLVPADGPVYTMGAALRAQRAALPDCLSVLVVLDPGTHRGTLYRTNRLPARDLRFEPLPVPKSRRDGADPSATELRLQVLDALLSTLEVAH